MNRMLQMIATAEGCPDNLFGFKASTARRWGYTLDELRDPAVSEAFFQYRANRYLDMLGLEEWPHVVDLYIVHLLDPVRPIGVIPDVGTEMREALARRLMGL